MDGPVSAPAFSLRQLLYFVTVAEAGTIREAARLHVTESAVSVAITELERAMRVRLCVRRRALGVTLTPSGLSTLRRAKVLLRQAGELAAEASGGPGALAGPLPRDHPLAGAELDLAALQAEPMVLLDAPPSSYHALRICADAGIRPVIRYRTANFETARALVGRGLGWTLLVSRPELDFTYEGLGVVPVEPGSPVLAPVGVVLAWADDAALSPRAREFIRFAGTAT